jgi:glucokinase
MNALLLAGDIGATKTVLALYDINDINDTGDIGDTGGARNDLPAAEATFRNKEFSGLAEVISSFLAGRQEQPVRACFGVAGPVRENRVRMTNLDWDLDGSALAAQFRMEEVLLVNDLVATTAGAVHLPQDSLVMLNQGRSEAGGNIGVLAVGTGLGQSFAVPLPDEPGKPGELSDRRFRPFPTEGGHVSFAPRNQEQIELLRFMFARSERQQQTSRSRQFPHVKFQHVSAEQVCSGRALPDLYDFQCTLCPEPEGMRAKRLAAEPDALSPLIVEAANAALAGKLPCEPAVRAVRLLLDILAAEAANFSLKVLACGGIFLGGGMLPRLLAHIDPARFMEIFCRGVYRDMLADIPVHIITEPKTALLGARQLAMQIKK